MLSAPCPVLGNRPINTHSNNRRGVLCGVCPVLGNGPMYTHSDTWHVFSVRSDPSLYNERRTMVEEFSWGFSCGVLTSGQRKLRFGTRKRLVKTLQRNYHCGELLSRDQGVEVQVPTGARIFSSPCRPHLLWGSPTPLSNGYRGFSPRGVKRQGREADHSPPASTEVKKMWIYTSTPPYAFMAYCLISWAQGLHLLLTNLLLIN
jgi:hypothetical protein